MCLGDVGQRERLCNVEGEPPGLDQFADLGKYVECPTGVAPAEPNAELLGAGEVGDCDDVFGAAREVDEAGQHAAARDVECSVDAAGSKFTDPGDHVVAIEDGGCAERMQHLMRCRAAGADHACSPRYRELDSRPPDDPGSTVDQ